MKEKQKKSKKKNSKEKLQRYSRQMQKKKKIKTKILVDFDHSVAFSVKSLAVKNKKNMKIKPTGRFFSEKNSNVSKITAYKFYLESN